MAQQTFADGVLMATARATINGNASDAEARLQALETSEIAASLFRITDPAIPTKKLAFDVSGISAAVTRTYAWPNINGTVLVDDGANVPVAGSVHTARALIAAGIISSTPTVDWVALQMAGSTGYLDVRNAADTAYLPLVLRATKVSTTGDLVVGPSDPGGSERLRVSGAIKASGGIESQGYLVGGPTATTLGRMLYSGATSGDHAIYFGKAEATNSCSLLKWDQSNSLLKFGIYGSSDMLRVGASSVVVGPSDPGGSEKLRVGGDTRASGVVKAESGVFGSDGAAVTPSALNTWYSLGNSTNMGLIVFRDGSLGGSAVFVVDTSAGAISIQNGITGFEVRYNSGNTEVRVTGGSVPRAIKWCQLSATPT